MSKLKRPRGRPAKHLVRQTVGLKFAFWKLGLMPLFPRREEFRQNLGESFAITLRYLADRPGPFRLAWSKGSSLRWWPADGAGRPLTPEGKPLEPVPGDLLPVG